MQSGITENQWLSAMSSHFAYWGSSDVALFIMRALHHHDVYFGAKATAQESSKDGTKQPKDDLNDPTSPLGQDRSANNSNLQQGKPSQRSIISSLSLPSSPIARELLSPSSQKSQSKSSSTVRGKSDPEDWW